MIYARHVRRRRESRARRGDIPGVWFPAAALAFLAIGAGASTVSSYPPTPPLPVWAQVQKAVPKRALVIGIADYKHATILTTPPVDATAIAAALTKADPGIVLRSVPTNKMDRKGLIDELMAFAATVEEGDVAFVFYSGHGIERDGVNYIVPSDAQKAEAGREGFEYIAIDHVSGLLRNAKAGGMVLILDACRTDPFGGAASRSDLLEPQHELVQWTHSATAPAAAGAAPPAASVGLAEVKPPTGMITVYAAASRMPSYSRFSDEPETVPSIFTRKLVQVVETLNQPVHDVFGVASGEVSMLTKDWQTPFVSSYSGGKILLLPNDHLTRDEDEAWGRTASLPPNELPAQLRRFVILWPSSVHAAAARTKIQELAAQSTLAATQPLVKPANTVVLSGALQSGGVQTAQISTAIAQQDVFVRAAPIAGTTPLGSLRRGAEVRIVDGAARQGWAKVLLENGAVGYVGNVTAASIASAPTVLSARVPVNNREAAVAAITDAWRNAAPTSTLAINVNPAIGQNAWHEEQQAFLAALRLRDTALAQGLRPANVALTIGAPSGAAAGASMAVIGGAKK